MAPRVKEEAVESAISSPVINEPIEAQIEEN